MTSVATGQNDFYPLYLSISNVHNNVHHAHCNALVVIGFLAITKGKLIQLFCCLSLLMSAALLQLSGHQLRNSM